MQVDQGLAKVWSRVRDGAAMGSGMMLVGFAETWAKRMEKEIARGAAITPQLVLNTADPDLSGYQVNSAYNLLRVYWVHRKHLVWEKFWKVPVNSNQRTYPTKTRERFRRRHSARTVH